jgi:quercetin dioxygenase-like cupin family protein
MFSGKVIELGERHHLPAPVNRRRFDSIRSLEVEHGSFQKVPGGRGPRGFSSGSTVSECISKGEPAMKVVKVSRVPAEAAGGKLFTGPITRQPIVSGKESSQFAVHQVNFARGVRNKFHTHTNDQILIVTSGKGTCATADGEVTVFPGDVILFPAGENIGTGRRPIRPFPISISPVRTQRRRRSRNSAEIAPVPAQEERKPAGPFPCGVGLWGDRRRALLH